jgi:hypothetical protein
VTTIKVSGLKGVTYKDKVQKGAEATEQRDELTVSSEVDRLYANVPNVVTVSDGGNTLFKVERSKLDDVVVWNPWEGAANMADFGPADGYKNMGESRLLCTMFADTNGLLPISLYRSRSRFSVADFGAAEYLGGRSHSQPVTGSGWRWWIRIQAMTPSCCSSVDRKLRDS